MPITFTDLPYDLFIDHLFPFLPTSSLLALKRTCKLFAEAGSDSVFWKRRLQTDYNFPTSGDTARTNGFDVLYKGMRKPRVYMWGTSTFGRLGLDEELLDDSYGVPIPTELKFESRIVSLTSGGWSFHALDDTGAINVWGTLHGEVDQESPEDDPWFAEPGATAFTPIKLELPNRMVAVSCSRSHSAALDAKNRVWIFTRWGRPSLLTFTGDLEYAHRHPRINNTKVIQVECGWGFTSFLTEDGRAYVIWPGSGSFADQEAIKNSDLDREGEKYQAKAVNGIVKCLPVEISAEPLTLPELPELPPLSSSLDEKPKGSAGTNPKLIKIAAGEHFIIGLTDQGHVVCIDLVGGDGEEDGVGYLRSVFTNGQRGWDYLPEYCDIQNVVKDPVYSPSDSGAPKVAAPKKLKITHISAHFNYFVAYSPNECSTVLMSFVKREDKSTIGSITRTIHPTLQNKDIISIVLGDYHFGALHADGTLYTWGAYSNGALGLGDPLELPIGAPGGYATAKDLRRARRDSDSEEITPPEVSSPTPVRFDWYHPGRKRFCYAVAAAGWHMGALVIDLDEYPDDEEAVRLAMVKKRQRSFSMRRFFRRYLCGCFGI